MSKIRRSLRKSKSVNPGELQDAVADEIINMNSNIRSLEGFSRLLGTPKDNGDLRNKIQNLQKAIKKTISSITSNIKELKHTSPKDDKVLQLQIGKFEETFVAALNKYEALQKELIQKQKSHTLVTVDLERPSSDYEQMQQASQRQSQIIAELKFKQENLSKIQTDIVDVHGIMRELSSMVEKQGECVDKVEENISEVAQNVELGAKDLNNALGRKKRSRNSAVYVSLIILVIVLILVAILYSRL